MITHAELDELIAVCDFVEGSPNLDSDAIYTCEDRHDVHVVRTSVIRRMVDALREVAT